MRYIPQNWWLEDYLPIMLWFSSFWQTEKIFKHVCFWNALQTCLAFFKVTKVAGLLEFFFPGAWLWGFTKVTSSWRTLGVLWKNNQKNVTIFLRNSQCFHLRTKILHKFSWMLAHPSPARKLKTKSCSLYRFQYLSFVQNTKTVATFR